MKRVYTQQLQFINCSEDFALTHPQLSSMAKQWCYYFPILPCHRSRSYQKLIFPSCFIPLDVLHLWTINKATLCRAVCFNPTVLTLRGHLFLAPTAEIVHSTRLQTVNMACTVESKDASWVTAHNKWPQLFLFVFNPYSHYRTLWGCDWVHDKCTSLYVCEELLSDMKRREWKSVPFYFDPRILLSAAAEMYVHEAELPGKRTLFEQQK